MERAPALAQAPSDSYIRTTNTESRMSVIRRQLILSSRSAQARCKGTGNSIRKKSGALLEKAPRRFLFRWGSEEDFRRQLSDARITHLPCPKCAKCRIAIDLVKGADLVRAIYSSSAVALWSEIRVVEDVEVLAAKLKFPTLREVEVLGELEIPVGSLRKPKNVLADVTERTKNGRVVARCRP